MNASDYQEQAARTLLAEPGFEIPGDQLMVVWNALGLAGEAGEVAELVKKGVFHQHGLDREALANELGDVLWYAAALCTKLGLSLDDIMQANVEKLRRRYPAGFTAADSLVRVDTGNEEDPALVETINDLPPGTAGYPDPFGGPFIGLRAEESQARRQLVRARSPLYFAQERGFWACLPLARWSGRDVWSYIVTNDLPYNALYDLDPRGRELARNGAMFGGTQQRYAGQPAYLGRLAYVRRMYPEWFNRFAAEFPEVRAYV